MSEWKKEKRQGCFKWSDLEWNVYMPEHVLLLPWNAQWQIPNQSVLHLINFSHPVSENREYRQFSRSQGRSSFQPSVSLPVFYIPLLSFLHSISPLPPTVFIPSLPLAFVPELKGGIPLQGLIWAPSSHCHCQGIYRPAERLEKQWLCQTGLLSRLNSGCWIVFSVA